MDQEENENDGTSEQIVPDSPSISETAAPNAYKKADLKATGALYISTFLCFLFGLGLYDFLSENEPNKCGMSYMYEVPQFIPIVDNTKHSKYGLYAYGEGQTAEFLKKGQFTGIPVLFIPGNAGSHRQVRSMASVALRKSIEDFKYKIHFDYFAVDFNEEFSAIYGGTLQDQAAFVRKSIERILKLYDGAENAPKSVVLIGHSIGGLVARALFLDPNFNSKSVHTIITLATPHSAPVVNADRYLDQFYKEINAFWNQSSQHLDHVYLVAIGGGVNDIQVMPALTVSNQANIGIQTTAASGVWVSADHRCIVWCKQLVLALNRALFDLIESDSSKQLSNDKNKRNDVFRYHLVKRTAGKRYKTNLHPDEMVFDKEGDWKEIKSRQLTFQSDKKLTKNTYLRVPIMEEDPHHQMLSVDAINMDLDNWIFVCKETSIHNSVELCESGINLSDQSVIMPSNGKRKSVTIDLNKYEGSQIVIFMAKGMDHVRVTLDIYNKNNRNVEVKLPKWITFWYESRILKLTARDVLFYNLSIAELDSPWQAYEVSASTLKCTNKNENVSKVHFGLMKLTNSWALDQSYSLIGQQGSNLSNSIVAKLSTPKTSQILSPRTEVHLYLDPDCRYAISVRPDLSEMFAQIVRFYYPMIVPLSLSIVIMIMSNQLRILEFEGKVDPCHKILWSQVSPISSVMPSRLLGGLLGYLSIPIVHDYTITNERGIDFGVLPIMMYFISIGVVLIIVFSAFFTIILFGNLLQKFVTKFVNSQIPASGIVTEMVADSVISGLTKFPMILAAILMVLSTCTCGTVALCLGTLFQFLKLFKMYKKYLDWLVKKSFGMENQQELFEFDQLNFHLSLGLFWTLTTFLNVPSLLAWSHNLSFSPLALDHSYLISVIYCAILPILWSETYPNKFKMHYSKLAYGLQFCSILIVLFGLVSLYRINYVLCCAMIMLGAHQLASAVNLSKKFFEEIQEGEVTQQKEKTE